AMSATDETRVSQLGASIAGGLIVTVMMIYARGELGGVAVGSAVCITSILAGPVSGGSMNPARTVGPAIASNYYNGLWVYFVGPVTGTLLGAWSYRFVWVKDKPVQAISSMSSNDDREVTADDPLNSF
ncbi:hypothetical protein C3L33_18818, partial [Rhododendron williamsianum]